MRDRGEDGRGGIDAEAVEELAAELAVQYPEPVDVLEDGLARRLGLRRHPRCPLEVWRRVRVRFLERVG